MPTDGLVVVDKPAGWTSHDVVAKLRGVYGQRRVGHAGTLDPDATGVLLVGLGRATRLLRFLQETGKAYRASIVFGVATDTLDASGAVLDRTSMALDREQVEAALDRFRGEILQVPPMVSALKVGGRRLHELARRGEEVERPPRPVRVELFEVEAFRPGAYPEVTVLVECSSGTYVRSLAADLGVALGGCAHLGSLRRLRVGSFTLGEARPLEAIEADPAAAVLDPATAMRDLEAVTLDDEAARAVSHGATFPARLLLRADAGPGPFALLDRGGALLAVYERRGAGLGPAVVLAEPAKVFEFLAPVDYDSATTWTYTFEAITGGTRVTESFNAPLLNVEGSPSNFEGRYEMLVAGCEQTLATLKAAIERA